MRSRLLAVKANANREQNLPSLLEQLCRDAALLIQSKCKSRAELAKLA